jgi:NADH:ubiquinone oxidoreductase subunit F (NADH-binding)
VLDGLQLAAEAVGATQAYLYLHRGAAAAIERALAERAAYHQDQLPVIVAEAPPRFLAGQETAVVNWLSGGPAVPVFTPPRVTEQGLAGRPTLVQNVETLAHLALIARFGPRWFRTLSTAAEPGTMLVTRYPAAGGSQVTEVPIGTPLAALFSPEVETAAWLVGGYHGSWLASQGSGLTLDNSALRPLGAAVGAGVLAALPASRCGVTETARVIGYLAAESAGQCGPCLNGLPRIAAALAELPGTRPRQNARSDIERWAGLVAGRGACSHPDGTVRLVRSALGVFDHEFARHERGNCSAASRRPFLPLPDDVPTSETDWT